jgi:hypothetical protein
MTIKSVIGSTVQIGTALGSPLTINSISNANPAVAALAATTGLASDDVTVITSSWDLLNGRVTKGTLAASDWTLIGIDTSDTNRFPAAGGAASANVKEVTTWTQLGQIREWTSSGGEPEFEDITTIADYVRKQKPTQHSPVTFDMTLFWDPKLAWWDTIVGVSESLAEYPFRIVLAGATDTIYGNGYLTLGKIPTITGRLFTTRVGFSISSQITVL